MKRRVVIVAVFLLAGAVVNVAVAWGCAAWSPLNYSTPTFNEAASQAWASHGQAGRVPDEREGLGVRYRGAYEQQLPDRVTVQIRAGSPVKSFVAELLVYRQPKPPELRGAWRVNTGTGIFRHRVIPHVPITYGFAINTLFYATLLWLLICGLFLLRRFRRIGRGLCPRCAYPMGTTDVCTECGAELPDRVRAAT